MAIVQLKQVEFGWSPNSTILQIDSLEINKGEKVFICGPSGSGKSTLLSLVGGVLLPRSGEMNLLDRSLSSLGASERDQFRADHIGFIFQQFNLIPYLSLRENVELPGKFSKLRKSRSDTSTADKLLTEMQLDSSLFDQRTVSQLSTGQQQRVAAARALYGSPELIIADEPTSALDYDAREGFLNLLFDECQKSKSTLLFVSHDRELGKLFDRIIQLDELNRVAKR